MSTPHFSAVFPSPLGPLHAKASDEGIVFLKATDDTVLSFESPTHPHLVLLGRELAEYFDGARRDFSVPLAPVGSEFQTRVWRELRAISWGETISYGALAARIERPSAIRAVARANATNPVWIVIPCHRVIGKNGVLAGYAGGLWRKRWLLEGENCVLQWD